MFSYPSLFNMNEEEKLYLHVTMNMVYANSPLCIIIHCCTCNAVHVFHCVTICVLYVLKCLS